MSLNVNNRAAEAINRALRKVDQDLYINVLDKINEAADKGKFSLIFSKCLSKDASRNPSDYELLFRQLECDGFEINKDTYIAGTSIKW